MDHPPEDELSVARQKVHLLQEVGVEIMNVGFDRLGTGPVVDQEVVEEDVDDWVGEALVTNKAAGGSLDDGVVVGERVDVFVESNSFGQVANDRLLLGTGEEVGGDIPDPD